MYDGIRAATSAYSRMRAVSSNIRALTCVCDGIRAASCLVFTTVHLVSTAELGKECVFFYCSEGGLFYPTLCAHKVYRNYQAKKG